MRRTLFAAGMVMVLTVVSIAGATAQEISVFGGVMRNSETHTDPYVWQLEYMQGMSDHFAWSFSYLNEGHVPEHHRDGPLFQFWARTDVGQRLSLGAGIGPYYYFDTTGASQGASYANDHGWGAVFSLAATWRVGGRWLMELRGNWVRTGSGADNISALAGIGYELEAPPVSEERYSPEKPACNEVTLFFGQTIVNSFNSDKSTAAAIEYRRDFADLPLAWTATWLYEGDNGVERRNGLMTQLWLQRAFFDDRVTLGIGGGPFVVVDTYRPKDDETVVGVFSITAGYRLSAHWIMRLSWNRVVTNYNSDADVILAGLGYRF